MILGRLRTLVSKKRSTGMTLVPSERLPTKMVSLMETSQRFGGRGGRNFLSKDLFEPLDHEILDRGPAFGCRDFGSLENFSREINRRLHATINTGILLPVKDLGAVGNVIQAFLPVAGMPISLFKVTRLNARPLMGAMQKSVAQYWSPFCIRWRACWRFPQPCAIRTG